MFSIINKQIHVFDFRLNHDWSARHGGKDVPLMVPPPGPPKIGDYALVMFLKIVELLLS